MGDCNELFCGKLAQIGSRRASLWRCLSSSQLSIQSKLVSLFDAHIPMEKRLAPIVLFVYARPMHTAETLKALALNELALQSDLYVYCDAARNQADQELVGHVRAIVKGINGFNSVTIIERQANFGLAKNIIQGVSEVISEHGTAIVLEDDIVTNSEFLCFMNSALQKYAEQKDVWHVSGWNYPIDFTDIGDSYFWRIMNCWGSLVQLPRKLKRNYMPLAYRKTS